MGPEAESRRCTVVATTVKATFPPIGTSLRSLLAEGIGQAPPKFVRTGPDLARRKRRNWSNAGEAGAGCLLRLGQSASLPLPQRLFREAGTVRYDAPALGRPESSVGNRASGLPKFTPGGVSARCDGSLKVRPLGARAAAKGAVGNPCAPPGKELCRPPQSSGPGPERGKYRWKCQRTAEEAPCLSEAHTPPGGNGSRENGWNTCP